MQIATGLCLCLCPNLDLPASVGLVGPTKNTQVQGARAGLGQRGAGECFSYMHQFDVRVGGDT